MLRYAAASVSGHDNGLHVSKIVISKIISFFKNIYIGCLRVMPKQISFSSFQDMQIQYFHQVTPCWIAETLEVAEIFSSSISQYNQNELANMTSS